MPGYGPLESSERIRVRLRLPRHTRVPSVLTMPGRLNSYRVHIWRAEHCDVRPLPR